MSLATRANIIIFPFDFVRKINPLHQVPVLVDGDLTISDSRAIACYLANLKAGNSIYPSDPRKRAVVDQYLFMDCSWIYPTWYDNAIVRSRCCLKFKNNSNIFQKAVLAQTATTIFPEAREKIHAMLTHLNNILSGSQYLCGDVVTLADLSVVGSIGVLIVTRYLISHFQLRSFI